MRSHKKTFAVPSTRGITCSLPPIAKSRKDINVNHNKECLATSKKVCSLSLLLHSLPLRSLTISPLCHFFFFTFFLLRRRALFISSIFTLSFTPSHSFFFLDHSLSYPSFFFARASYGHLLLMREGTTFTIQKSHDTWYVGKETNNSDIRRSHLPQRGNQLLSTANGWQRSWPITPTVFYHQRLARMVWCILFLRLLDHGPIGMSTTHHDARDIMRGDNSMDCLDFEDKLEILDLCCGPATWLCGTCPKYPNCNFTGIDMSSNWPQSIRPANIRTKQANILKGLPFSDKTFGKTFATPLIPLLLNFTCFCHRLHSNAVRQRFEEAWGRKRERANRMLIIHLVQQTCRTRLQTWPASICAVRSPTRSQNRWVLSVDRFWPQGKRRHSFIPVHCKKKNVTQPYNVRTPLWANSRENASGSSLW